MKIDATVWQAGKDLQEMEGLQQYAKPLRDDAAGTIASPPSILHSIWSVYAANLQKALTRIQNRADTDAARWLLGNVGSWLTASMEGNGAAHWLCTYKEQVLRAYKAAKADGSPDAKRAWTKELIATQTAQTALGTLCQLVRDIQAWTALQDTAQQSTCTPPQQEEGAQLPTIYGSQKEEGYYRRAIERGYMERRGDGYQWRHPQVRLAYFLQLCYSFSNLQDTAFKAQAGRLFGIPRVDRAFTNLESIESPQHWRAQMDKDFAGFKR